MHTDIAPYGYGDFMARRLSRSQLQSQLRQAQARQRQAISKYNSEVRKVNRAVADHNRRARVHNARVRTNRARLKRELQRLSRAPASTTIRYRAYRRSVVTLHQSFQQMEATAEAGTWAGDDALFEMSEGETANSLAVLNALVAEVPHVPPSDDEVAALQTTSIGEELARIDPDLDQRWRGALFALSPSNPDAGRHFCTSAREMLDRMLMQAAPAGDVFAADPDAARTQQGLPTRRSRIEYCLSRSGPFDDSLAAFVDADLEDVIALFAEFNHGTHGSAGRFDQAQLHAIKLRVEDAVRFVARIVG